MSAPPIPPAFELLGHRPFSFYPPILAIEHNEFRYLKSTWSEVLVVNTKSQEEIWIPRRFVGEVSRVDEPVMILGLLKELEYRGGQILPHTRRVIEMPRAVNAPYIPGSAAEAATAGPAPVVGIRLENNAENRVGRLILSALAIGVVACVAVVGSFRFGRDGSRVAFSPVMQADLDLTSNDQYPDVVRKLGPPDTQKWRSSQGELQYRILQYRERGIFVILMGEQRDKASYIGSVNDRGRPVHVISLPGGRDTASMLRSLGRF